MLPFCRILLVDDFEPFRRFVRMSLQARAEFRIVGEALDGMEAIQKAEDLQPDLILLDIGLPKLNGMVAAEQIRTLAPDAKLLFVSLESSSPIGRGFPRRTRLHSKQRRQNTPASLFLVNAHRSCGRRGIRMVRSRSKRSVTI